MIGSSIYAVIKPPVVDLRRNRIKNSELTLKRPFIQFEVQVFNLPVVADVSDSANEVHQHLFLQAEGVSHR